MITKAAPQIAALDAQAAAHLFLSDHLRDRCLADDPQLGGSADAWHVPVLLTYLSVGAVGHVGENVGDAHTGEIIFYTAAAAMKQRALALYDQHRELIQAVFVLSRNG